MSARIVAAAAGVALVAGAAIAAGTLLCGRPSALAADASASQAHVPDDAQGTMSEIAIKHWLVHNPDALDRVTHFDAVVIVSSCETCLELQTKSAGVLADLVPLRACTLFVVDDRKLDDDLHLFPIKTASRPVTFPASSGLVGRAATTNEIVTTDDPTTDPLFDRETDGFGLEEMPGHAMAFVPLRGEPAERARAAASGDASAGLAVVGVLAVVHRRSGVQFTPNELLDLSLFCHHVGLVATRLVVAERKSSKRRASVSWQSAARESRLVGRALQSEQSSVALLGVISEIFSELGKDDLIRKIISNASQLMRADGCSIFLKDGDELYARVFQRRASSSGPDPPQPNKEIRFPITAGIAGHVASTGKMVNILDAYADERFNRDVDRRTGFRTRTILCCPIVNQSGKLLGVAQLVNKLTVRGEPDVFSSSDETLLEGFATFCGIAIHNAQVMEQVRLSDERQKVAMELISYHLQPDDAEVARFATVDTRHVLVPVLSAMRTFAWSPRELVHLASDEFSAPELAILLVLEMVHQLGFVERYSIPYETMVRFVLTVKRNYRDVQYHCWWHAVCVTHAFYTLHLTLGLGSLVLEHEVFGMFVAALCHDIDHRGRNNAFQVASESPLAKLYEGGSVMERHHFAHSLLILGQAKTNILQSLDKTLFEAVLQTMKATILATDLERHFPNLKKFATIRDNYNRALADHRDCLCGLIISACDLSSSFKPWPVQTMETELVFAEFFAQGDEERAFGLTPIEMLDRYAANIPKMEVGFFDFVAIPTYRALAEFSAAAQPLLDAVLANRAAWENQRAAQVQTSDSTSMPTHMPTL